MVSFNRVCAAALVESQCCAAPCWPHAKAAWTSQGAPLRPASAPVAALLLTPTLTAPPSCTALLPHAGDMATWHQAADPLLSSDISALARTVSRYVHTCAPGEDLGAAMSTAVSATAAPAGASGSRLATLIVPHDLSWERADQPENGSGLPASALLNRAAVAAGSGSAASLGAAAQQFVRDAAAALKACPRGKAAVYIGGRAALAEGEC